MHSPKNILIAFLFVELLRAANSATAADASWRNKRVAEWTEEDAQQVLTDSPWAKRVIPILLHQQSEFERRDGGNMGTPTGVGYDGVADNESRRENRHGGAPSLLLRWETAMPVRAARFKGHTVEPPTLETDCYVLALYGVPGGYFKGDPVKLGKPLKDLAALRREGKADVKPSRVEVFQGEAGPIVVYEFPRTLEITKDDKSLTFSAVVGRLSLIRVFDTGAMHFEGKLEY